MKEQALTKPQVIATLTKAPHGKLVDYLAVGVAAAREDADFFAHLVAWNALKGQVRDAKVALPVIALALAHRLDDVGRDNALAHLGALDVRSFVQALDFADGQFRVETAARVGKKLVKRHEQVQDKNTESILSGGLRKTYRRLAERYLRELEASPKKWDDTALQNRAKLRRLYTYYAGTFPGQGAEPTREQVLLDLGTRVQRTAPTLWVEAVKKYRVGRWAVIQQLPTMTPDGIAGAVEKYHLPFLVLRGALGKRCAEPDVLLALIARMSPPELTTNMKWLERLGVRTVPALRAGLEAALAVSATAKPKRGGSLKASRAADALEASGDTQLASKLRGVQEKQLDALGKVEGRWLVLADKSGSMAGSIEMGRQVAALLARMVGGQVHLVFFDDQPRYYDATGQSYEALQRLTRGIAAGGGTSIGCGVDYLRERGIEVDGIALVSDGAHHHGQTFSAAYAKYAAQFAVEPTTYFYEVDGEEDTLSAECERAGIDVQHFPLRGSGADYTSLPNLVQTMRVQKYRLLDEVLATPLRTLDAVLPRTKGMAVLAKQAVTA